MSPEKVILISLGVAFVIAFVVIARVTRDEWEKGRSAPSW